MLWGEKTAQKVYSWFVLNLLPLPTSPKGRGCFLTQRTPSKHKAHKETFIANTKFGRIIEIDVLSVRTVEVFWG
jgi:hypothetical protein